MKKKYCKGCFNNVTDSGICECGEHSKVGTFNEEQMEQIEKELHEHIKKTYGIAFIQKSNDSTTTENIDMQGSIEKVTGAHHIVKITKNGKEDV